MEQPVEPEESMQLLNDSSLPLIPVHLLLEPQYALREGIEATMSQGVRAFGMRRSQYVGFAKTHLQHLGIAAAINLVRVVAWLDGEELAPTRISAFQRLYKTA